MKEFDFLDDIGGSKEGLVTIKDFVGNTILKTIKESHAQIQRNGARSSGNLIDIKFEVERFNDGRLNISFGYLESNPAKDYYDYVDKGVNGTIKKHGSPYSYKNNFVSRDMVNAIKAWIKTNGISGRNEGQKYNTNKTQKKRNALKDKDSMAYGISVGIKKNGKKPINFFEKIIINNFGADFLLGYSEEIGKAMAINITKDDYNKKS